MGRKWLDLTPWRTRQGDLRPDESRNYEPRNDEPRQDDPSLSGTASGAASGDQFSFKTIVKESVMPQAVPTMRKTPADVAAEGDAGFSVELLPVEDIFRAAGITNPRKGYNILKVVEMLHSQHLSGLSKELKRAAVLMALDAAGVPIEQLRLDAKVRQDALDAYEAEQKKQCEAEWARKTELNTQIQAEMESVQEHYLARISRNQEGIAREKARFNDWLTAKQQQTESMTEAVELCLKPLAPEPVAAPPPQASMVAAAGGKSS